MTSRYVPLMIGSVAADTGLGPAIRAARERKHWTQRRLAAALEVDPKTVRNWENGRGVPRNRIAALEALFGISLPGGSAPEGKQPLSEDEQREKDMQEFLRLGRELFGNGQHGEAGGVSAQGAEGGWEGNRRDEGATA